MTFPPSVQKSASDPEPKFFCGECGSTFAQRVESKTAGRLVFSPVVVGYPRSARGRSTRRGLPPPGYGIRLTPISFWCFVIYKYSLPRLEGGRLDLAELRGRSTLIVNVASQCGLTPQYEGLELLHEAYADRGLTVIGVPCNQFGDQEPGSLEEIAEFCWSNYRVSFPLTAKLEVNGSGRHPLYEELIAAADSDGQAGDVQWNFEKFLVSPEGEVLERFRPLVAPDAPEVIAAIEAALPPDTASLARPHQ